MGESSSGTGPAGNQRMLDKADRIGMYISIGVVALGSLLALVPAVGRLREVGDGRDVPVTVPLSGHEAELPLGPDGAAVTASVDTATVVVPNPAPATLFALYAQPIWTALMVIVACGFAAALFLRLARGTAFSGRTSRLIYIGAGVLLVGWFGSGVLMNMTTNGALSALSDYTYDDYVIFETSLAPFFVYLVVGAFAAAFQVGERLQRDTEGLV
ncbi:hypothetical protein [Demequina globuliformis]|uniref:hypothetical protein n=1 Tax=Demequina globuliformis TaxID=676202 RepID=UPI0007803872|nr:hypothetical protein [Demequina globuliformis]